MNFEKTALFELASQRMRWLSDRQKVVSENIANADTSGYRAREVVGFDRYLESANGMAVAPNAEVTETEATWGEDLSGNNVVMEEQLLLASSTAGQYRLASTLYRKAHEMLITVSGSR